MDNIYIYEKRNGVKNWYELEGVHYPINLERTLDESYDRGGFIQRTTRKEIHTRNRHIKVITDNKTFYFLGNDVSDQIRFIEDKHLYQHQWMLCEPTKKLEKIFISGYAIKQPISGPPVTLADCVDTILAINPLRRVGDPQFYILDEALRGKLSQVISPEFTWTKGMSLVECLQDVGRIIGAMPRLAPSSVPGEDWKYNTITFEDFGKIRDNVNIAHTAYQQDCSEEYYCTQLETFSDNLYADTLPGSSNVETVYPGNDTWITPRCDDKRMVESNISIHLPFKIQNINKILMRMPAAIITYMSRNYTDGSVSENLTADDFITIFDITHFIYSYDKWLALPNPAVIDNGQETQANTIYYKKGERSISLGGQLYYSSVLAAWLNIGGQNILKNLYNLLAHIANTSDIMNNSITLYTKPEHIWGYREFSFKQETFINGDSYNGQSIIPVGVETILYDFDPRNDVKFRIFYKAFSPARLTAQKEVIPDDEEDCISSAYNPNGNDLSAGAVSKNMWGRAQSSGSKDIKVVKYGKSVNDMLEIGDIFEGAIITNINYEIMAPDSVKALITASKDFARISEFVSIDRHLNEVVIPLSDYIDCHIHYQDFCVISKNVITASPSILTTYGKRQIMRVFAPVSAGAKSTNVYAGTGSGDEIALSANVKPSAHSIAFSFETLDNYSAGKKRKEEGSDEIVDARYCDEEGNIEQWTIAFGIYVTEAFGTKEDLLPQIGDGDDVFPSSLIIAAGHFIVKKTAFMRMLGTYQIHFTSDDVNIIVGDKLISSSPLLLGKHNEIFKLWKLNKPVTYFNQVIGSGFGQVIDSGYVPAVNINNMSLTVQNQNLAGGKGWAITDEAGNLYLAENTSGDTESMLKFNFIHDRA